MAAQGSKLNEPPSYYAPKKNKHYARYMFLKMRPTHGESTTSYAARLREKASDCEFQDADDRLLEHIIQTTENQSFVKKTINRKWSLSEMLREVHILEDTSLQIHGMPKPRGFLPKIVQEHGEARMARAPSAFIRLPAIQKTEAEAPKKSIKPPRLPVLVDARFKLLPKCGPAVPKATEMLTRCPNRLRYDHAGGDAIHKSDANAVADPSCVADSWHINSTAEHRRIRIEKYARIFDVYVKETAEAIEREKHEAIRQERIKKYAQIFDVYVRETAEAMEREKKEAARKQRIEKYALIFDVYVRETAEAMEREKKEEIKMRSQKRSLKRRPT